MPLYEYKCDACGRRFEVIEKFSDPPEAVCKECGKGPVRRLLSSPAIQFKGSGWYVTDYAQKGKSDPSSTSSKSSDTAKSDATGGSGTAAKSDGARGDTTKGDTTKGDPAATSKPKDSKE